MTAALAPDQQEAIERFVAGCKNDPLRFVSGAYPWGSGELEDEEGIYEWQREALEYIGDELERQDGERNQIVRLARSSGHGIGKSALSAWLVDWAMSTMANTRVVVTSNTESQLKTKFGGELHRWRNLSITESWFEIKALSMYSKEPKQRANWRCDLTPWSETNPEAFAGLHNKRRRILLIMDEASAIPQIIWETAAGAMTDEYTQIIWVVFGNPTRNTGSFRECFHAKSKRWNHAKIDARTVPGTNKELFREWEEDHGEDSDFFRVRVRGEFPRQSALQFISEEAVTAATEREPTSTPEDPLIVGIDVARQGMSDSVIWLRRGRDAQRVAPKILPDTHDSDRFAAQVAMFLNEHRPDAVFIDGGGIGGPIADRLKTLGWDVVEVQFGGKADNDERFANKRSEMWSRMKSWLDVGAIYDTEQGRMKKECCAIEAWMDRRDRVLLESKDSLIKRGESSPDMADALALTFAFAVTSRRASPLNRFAAGAGKADTDYDMYGD